MRKLGLGAAVALLLGALAAFFFDWPTRRAAPIHDPPPPSKTESDSTPHATRREFTPANSRPVERSTPGIVLLPDAEAMANRLHAPEATAADDIEILQTIFASYRSANGGVNPSGGLNEEIMDVLRGKNSKHVAAFPPNHPSLDAQGRLLDRWSTPYFFHPVSGKVLEVRSAGPDRKLWTGDDVDPGRSGR